MTDVEIKYCVPCGHLERAEEVQHELLDEFGRELDGVRLNTGENGVFKIWVDDELVYDKSTDGGFDLESIKDEIRARATA
ncbi:MAG: SelT/SelW/SelH family protein [Halobacteriaceae archaeon]